LLATLRWCIFPYMQAQSIRFEVEDPLLPPFLSLVVLGSFVGLLGHFLGSA
jgi:uncharacterized metal-binding protein